MKKTILNILAILALAVFLATGTYVLSLAKANPYPYGGQIAADSSAKPPKISILSPLNSTAHSRNSLALSINVSFPESTYASGTGLVRVYYRADWQQNETTLFDTNAETLAEHYFACTQDLTEIPEGNHSLKVYADGGGYYPPRGYPHFYNDQYLHEWYTFSINSSSTILFTIYTTPPVISDFSIENKTYNLKTIPLNFTVNHSFSWITYNLDNQANTTITGNPTLTGLTEGIHSIILYANDTAGNIGKSDTIFFTVDTATPKPSPSSSPSQQPTPAPAQSEYPFTPPPSPPPPIFKNIIIASAIIGVTIIGLAAYFKLRKKQLKISQETSFSPNKSRRQHLFNKHYGALLKVMLHVKMKTK